MGKTYDNVKKILIENRQARNSDHRLIWEYAIETGIIKGKKYVPRQLRYLTDKISYAQFCNLPLETITRCRRKLQSLYPELRANEFTKRWRHEKEKTKGLFIFKD